jgi:hypothetical protein
MTPDKKIAVQPTGRKISNNQDLDAIPPVLPTTHKQIESEVYA